MKKTSIITAMLVLLASTNIGSSQLSPESENDFCRVLKDMITSSHENFETIKKERKTGLVDLYYTSKMNLPTSADTRIILNGEYWYLSCKMQEKSDKALLEKNYAQFARIIKGCLKSWKQFIPDNNKGNSIAFKETVDSQCGPKVTLSMEKNPAKSGYHKIMLTIHTN
ncbi:MAG: hypothetical protein EXR21_02690 [Flavobacteriaceae bacterium]|nr:hypothetical protein [Flavobacteriaceae bacterium]